MMKVSLPVSGLEVTLRQPAGDEDMLLLEAPTCDVSLALTLIQKIAAGTRDLPVSWETLSITDLDALLLGVRQMVFGDLVRADTRCPSQNCEAKIEVAFRIGDYLIHHQPQTATDVELAEESGWFRFTDQSVSFRLPTVGDRMAIARHSNPAFELAQRCIRPTNLAAEDLERVEQAMATMAPSLCNVLEGRCPECEAAVDLAFDPQQFTLQELRDQAAFIYDDIHLLAACYQWSEADILALPRHRRYRYAERVRLERRSA
jgi:hypothetical protein